MNKIELLSRDDVLLTLENVKSIVSNADPDNILIVLEDGSRYYGKDIPAGLRGFCMGTVYQEDCPVCKAINEELSHKLASEVLTASILTKSVYQRTDGKHMSYACRCVGDGLDMKYCPNCGKKVGAE